MWKKVERYLKETAAEMRKMTWPTKDELVGSTMITVIFSLLTALFIGVVDRLLVVLIKQVFGGGIQG